MPPRIPHLDTLAQSLDALGDLGDLAHALGAHLRAGRHAEAWQALAARVPEPRVRARLLELLRDLSFELWLAAMRSVYVASEDAAGAPHLGRVAGLTGYNPQTLKDLRQKVKELGAIPIPRGVRPKAETPPKTPAKRPRKR